MNAREAYFLLRKEGWHAREAWHFAKVKAQWDKYEKEGRVKLEYESDQCMYDDSYIDTWGLTPAKTSQEKKKLWEQIERKGVWVIVGYFRVQASEPWEVGASLGSIIGLDSAEESSVIDETLSSLEDAFADWANDFSEC